MQVRAAKAAETKAKKDAETKALKERQRKEKERQDRLNRDPKVSMPLMHASLGSCIACHR